ncbi:MAG: glycosyltransferase [Fidelibacterota bacterium]
MTTALVHYWFYAMRGGERVVEKIAELFPDAPIYTHLFLQENLSETLRKHPVHTSFIAEMPYAKSKIQAYLPFMPMALNRFGLYDYDLVISSESGPAKGVNVRADAKHICYCHSPMRYLWFQQEAYLAQSSFFERLFLKSVTPRMRQWDLESAKGVDVFVANSKNVQERIYQIYQRDSEIIYPPVDVDQIPLKTETGESFLWVGQLVPYKRPDLMIEAFNKNGLPLRVVGTGPMLNTLQKSARSNIKFLGYVSDEIVHEELAKARALIFPGEEDFGMVPVEAQAAGTPVIAYHQGGAREWMTASGEKPGSVQLCSTGVTFTEQTEAGLQSALDIFIRHESEFSVSDCRNNAERFSSRRFQSEFRHFVESQTGEKFES